MREESVPKLRGEGFMDSELGVRAYNMLAIELANGRPTLVLDRDVICKPRLFLPEGILLLPRLRLRGLLNEEPTDLGEGLADEPMRLLSSLLPVPLPSPCLLLKTMF